MGDFAFKNCASLSSFPYLSKTKRIGVYNGTIRDCVFEGCTSLREISFPETTYYYDGFSKDYSHSGRFLGDTALESFTFPCDKTGYFSLVAADIADCPLRAISYSYADNIVPLNVSGSTIKKYEVNGNYNVTDPSKSILYVKRGQRYKYIDAGYGSVFDIREMKEPQINIEGDIFSRYIDDKEDEHYNCNRYQVNLRWKLPLSDLNAAGKTVAHLYRDGLEVAEIIFEQPSEPKRIDKTEDPQAPDADVIEVKYTINGEEGGFKGDFDYLSEVKSDGTPVYTLIYGFQNKSLYYDATSHKMLNTMDTETFEPWFTFVDQFYSRPLTQIDAQESFVYTAELEPYGYTELYNNENLAEGEDGKLYSERTVDFPGSLTDGVSIHTSMATLRLDFDNLYTEEQVRADLDQTLDVTTMDNLNRKATLTYSLDPELVRQQGRYKPSGQTTYTTTDMINWVDLRELQEDGTFSTVLRNKHSVNRKAEDRISVNELNGHELTPGKTYQLVTSTVIRGEFGSKTITVPDVPALKCGLTLKVTEHAMADPDGHTWIPFNAMLPRCPPMVNGMRAYGGPSTTSLPRQTNPEWSAMCRIRLMRERRRSITPTDWWREAPVPTARGVPVRRMRRMTARR